MLKYIITLRPTHWIKNSFIFAPAFFAQNLSGTLREHVIVFLLFSVLNGALYTINDLFDIEVDRNDPSKKVRPVIAGALSISGAWIYSLILSLLTITSAFTLNVHVGFLFCAFGF